MLISLHSATIPYSFYNIREGINDELKVVTTVGVVSTTYTYVIPSGNYNSITLASLLEIQIPILIGDSLHIDTPSISFDDDTGKFTFSFQCADSYSNPQIAFKFNPADDFYPMNTELGFKEATYTFTRTGPALSKYTFTTTSVNYADLNGSIHGVYIRTNLVSKGTLDSQSGTFSNILERLPLSVQAGGILFHDASGGVFKKKIDLRVINIITIRLTDERNRVLDLNGLNFQLAIQVDFVYGKKPHLVKEGANSQNQGNSYAVTEGGNPLQIQMLEGQRRYQQQLEEEEKLSRRKRVGRPRNVGRPKGS